MNRTSKARGLATCAAILALPLALSAQQTDAGALQKRMAAIEADQKVILKELQEIKALLTARPDNSSPAPTAAAGVVSIRDAASRGNAQAKLTLVEFSDFQCPFCGRYARETYGQIQSAYVDTGKVHYVFRNLPLQNLHPQALGAAVAGECARAQGKFWELHDWMFANQNALARPGLLKGAEAAGLDAAAFDKCLGTEAPLAHIRQDLTDAVALGANATPAFFLAVEEKDGKVTILQQITGAKAFSVFKTAIDTILSSPALQD
jgi:protein-disulfide isomerase